MSSFSPLVFIQRLHEAEAALKKAEQALNEYEAKLGLMARLMKSKEAVADIDTRIDCMISDLTREGESQGTADTAEIVLKLKEIKAIINELE